MSEARITVITPPAGLSTELQSPAEMRTTLAVGQGPAGPPGPPGQPGAGSGSGDLHAEHQQMAASATWFITHNLGKRPSLAVFDSAGDEVYGAVHHIDINSLTVSFSAAFAGTAYLN